MTLNVDSTQNRNRRMTRSDSVARLSRRRRGCERFGSRSGNRRGMRTNRNVQNKRDRTRSTA